jgi:hypothetical protein
LCPLEAANQSNMRWNFLPIPLVTFIRKGYFILMMSQKTADYNQNPQIATQKMPKAFFATDLQQATGNRQQAIIHIF